MIGRRVRGKSIASRWAQAQANMNGAPFSLWAIGGKSDWFYVGPISESAPSRFSLVRHVSPDWVNPMVNPKDWALPPVASLLELER